MPLPSSNPLIPPKIQKPQMITLSTKNGTQHQHVTMHHLSDDEHLTILKVDEETDANHTSSSQEQNEDSETAKSDYIVLHKLPNGEALNLENLETYASMADVESGIKKTKPESYKPRSLEPFLDYDMPPSPRDMVISERPYPTPDTYEPIPLDELDDLEAMPDEVKPVYIINPLKGDQNISGEILPPTEEEVEEALMQANIELFKLNQSEILTTELSTTKDSDRQEKFLPGLLLGECQT